MALLGDGPWTLPISGYEVLQITFAYPLDVIVYGEHEARALMRFEGPFQFTDADGLQHQLDAADQSWAHMAVVLSLRHARVADAHVSRTDSTVRIEFERGFVLAAGPTPKYESWQVKGPGFDLVALPGGGVANCIDRT